MLITESFFIYYLFVVLDFISLKSKISMHCNKGVILSLDESIKIMANPTGTVREAAENWSAQFQQNKQNYDRDPRKWTPEPVRHSEVLPDFKKHEFIEALGSVSCTFIVEIDNTCGKPRQLLIEPSTTAHGINVALGYEELNI